MVNKILPVGCVVVYRKQGSDIDLPMFSVCMLNGSDHKVITGL